MKKVLGMEPTVLRRSVPIIDNGDGTFTFEGTGLSFFQDSGNQLNVYRSDSVPNVWLYRHGMSDRFVGGDK